LKKRDLEPTEENIIDSFVRNSVGRNDSLLKFIEMLNTKMIHILLLSMGDGVQEKPFL